jgi:hypothetical protein
MVKIFVESLIMLPAFVLWTEVTKEVESYSFHPDVRILQNVLPFRWKSAECFENVAVRVLPRQYSALTLRYEMASSEDKRGQIHFEADGVKS